MVDVVVVPVDAVVVVPEAGVASDEVEPVCVPAATVVDEGAITVGSVEVEDAGILLVDPIVVVPATPVSDPGVVVETARTDSVIGGTCTAGGVVLKVCGGVFTTATAGEGVGVVFVVETELLFMTNSVLFVVVPLEGGVAGVASVTIGDVGAGKSFVLGVFVPLVGEEG